MYIIFTGGFTWALLDWAQSKVIQIREVKFHWKIKNLNIKSYLHTSTILDDLPCYVNIRSNLPTYIHILQRTFYN